MADLKIVTDIVKRSWQEPAPGVETRQLTVREMAVIERIRELITSRPRRLADVICIDERDWVYPKLAPLIIQEQTHFQFGVRDYAGLSRVDASRKFWRAMENFCDRSNGIPGLPHWDWKQRGLLKRIRGFFARPSPTNT